MKRRDKGVVVVQVELAGSALGSGYDDVVASGYAERVAKIIIGAKPVAVAFVGIKDNREKSPKAAMALVNGWLARYGERALDSRRCVLLRGLAADADFSEGLASALNILAKIVRGKIDDVLVVTNHAPEKRPTEGPYAPAYVRTLGYR